MNPPNEHSAWPLAASVADKGNSLAEPVNDEALSKRPTMAVAVRPEMHLANRSTWALAVEPDSHATATDPNQKADIQAIEAWENEGDPNHRT
ncbi:MAG: hypothetical protein H2172_04370 [Opitutus sp.]|nr:hypothetical protein [Opitutus sp.]MCS6246495.1 hypothetical protein [Opitutus sp.]MCS6272797.1 hypothetical protein [Opitutus sp.]MCS6278051.1 hypothetical protein [Opitutus sp.]MCS6298841.1 hypothetical protein [Opitutus sp.]